MQHMNKHLSPPKPARVSVPVSAEALEAFQRLAKASGMSTGRAIAEWLDDTLDASRYVAETVEKARAAPKLVAQQLHAYALGLTDETGDLLARMKKGALRSVPTSAQRGSARSGEPTPPPCNTGGKVPPKTNPRGGKSVNPLPPAQVQAYADNNGVKPKAPK